MTTQQSQHSYEFGGPIGTLCTTLALPLVILFLADWTKRGNIHLADIPSLGNAEYYAYSLLGLIGYFGVLVLLWRILPGPLVEGVLISPPTETKKEEPFRLKYKLNGHLTFWVVMITAAFLPLNDYLYKYWESLAVVDIGLCLIASTVLYLYSFRSPSVVCAKGGNTGNIVYDWFMGRELNPRTGSLFDWKVFCELRPGLMGWMLLNYSCLQQQYLVRGSISGSMILVNLFQGIYVWDSLYQERAILTTMDVTTDGFGFMLCFGDLAWVPFTYSVPARYLVHHDPDLSYGSLAAIVILHIIGYTIFRLSNGQKDTFRRNPNDPRVSHLQYMNTKRGTRLLTSGWWGMARKINYTGDYIMGLTWCLVCGTQSLVPYFYAIYFAILLIHRSLRDDEACQAKYGSDWDQYKQLVPYKFIPGIV